MNMYSVVMPSGAVRNNAKCYHYSACYHHLMSGEYSVLRNRLLCQRLRCFTKSATVNGDCSCTSAYTQWHG